jgi:DNA-directed RNA polymerase subunit RPC12/RpoP
MLHYKCSKCKKITPSSDEATEENPTCMDCGARLILLKPLEGSPKKESKDSDKEDEDSEPRRRPASKTKRRNDDEDDKPKKNGRLDDDKPKKRQLDDEDDDKPKKKKRRSKKSKRENEGEGWAERGSTNDEGEILLGPRRDRFTNGNPTLRLVAIVCALLVLAGLSSCVLSMMMDLPSGTTLLTILALPGGLIGLLWCMNYLTLSVAVHAGGIVHSHRGKSRVISWDEIASVMSSTEEVRQNGELAETKYVYTIILTDTSNFVYTSKLIKDVEALGKIILDKTSMIMLPQVHAKYVTGDRYDFGRISVNQEGIHYKKQVLRWRDIKGVKSVDGYISVFKQGEWMRWGNIQSSSVPNLHVFLAFANEIADKDYG